jgi:hypothetical protein
MRYILVLFFSALLFAGCGEKDTTPVTEEKNKYEFDSTDIKTEPVENQDEQFSITYKFNQNTPYKYRITMLSDISQQTTTDTTINMNLKQFMVYLLQFTPRETDNDGVTELNFNISSAKVEMEGNGRKITYESDSIDTPEERDDFAEHHALINNPFSVRISRTGEILELYKMDKIINSYLDFKNLKDSVSAEDKNALKGQISETMLRPLITQIFRIVPETVVARDSTWWFRQPTRQMLVFKLDQTNKYKIKQLEKFRNDKVAVIDIDLETNISGESKVTEQGVNYNFNKPRISAAGTIHFNINEGFIQRVKTETHFETSVTAEAGGRKQSNREIVKNTNFVEKI